MGMFRKVSKHLSIYSEICNVMLFPHISEVTLVLLVQLFGPGIVLLKVILQCIINPLLL